MSEELIPGLLSTMNIITLLDAAFSFFKNFPPRLTMAEMKFELTCEEPIFAIAHPFSHPRFQCSRHITAYEAFRSLFSREQPTIANTSTTSWSNGETPPKATNISNPLQLNTLNMSVMVHRKFTLLFTLPCQHCSVLYAFLTTHLSLFSTVTVGFANESPGSVSFSAMKTALNNWAALWKAIQEQTPADEWAKYGFYRNSYNFWLVAQLLLSKRKSIDVAMGMKVNCDDKLKQLKVLLQEDGD